MSESFHGVLPALVTPFTDDGSAIDADALTAIVDRLISAGVGGLVPGGSTGEFTTLTHAERRELVELTVDAAAGRVPVAAGHRRAVDARDGRAERARRAGRRGRGDDRPAVLRRALVA
jgi:dihydrodipicolinate synthase/N-acetylneuraminate lyase